MKFPAIISAILLPLFFSCAAFAQLKKSFYDMEIPAGMEDSATFNEQNGENRIYVRGRIFTYAYTLKRNGAMYHYAVVQDERALLDSSYKYVDWMYVPIDSVFNNDKIYPVNKVELTVFDREPDFNGDPGLTRIKYEYYNDEKRIFLGDGKSAIESDKMIMLTPPGSHGFVFTTFNPIPIIKFPLENGMSWKQYTSFTDIYCDRAKIKFESADGLFHVNQEYRVTGELNINTRIGIIVCKKIEAVAKTSLGDTFATFYFNEQWGFVKTEYRNIDGSELVFQLVAVKDRQ